MQSFMIPQKIFFGADALQQLSQLEGKKAVLVTGGSQMKKQGILDTCAKLLADAGIESMVIDGVEPNPSVKTVLRGKEAMLQFEPDWIVAVGGGSALDAAKIMWTFYEYPELQFEDIIAVGSIPTLRNKARFIAIPSTSGTASEITAFSVITDTDSHIKYPIVSPEIIPDIAIVDPKIPATMPPHITANTGMDVLTHAIEAYTSTAANDYSDPLAIQSIRLVFEYVERAVKDGSDMEAREKMHNASTLAGMAFSNVSLGIVHSLAHKIGGEFDLTHGAANAILLPFVIDFNYEAAKEKFQRIEQELQIESLSAAVKALNAKVGIPATFSELGWDGLDSSSFDKVLPRMAKNALADPCSLTNPRTPSVEDMQQIYSGAFYGKN